MSAPAIDAAALASQAQYVEALYLMLSNSKDSAELKRADDAAVAFLKGDSAAQVLLQLLCQSQAQAVRQYAAVQLREKIVPFWKQSGGEGAQRIQAALVHLLTNEQDRDVRNAVVPLAAAVGKTLVPENRWPELTALLGVALGSASADARELGMRLLAELSVCLGEGVEGLAGPMKGPIVAGLVDPDPRVRREATKTLLAVLSQVESETVHELYADCFQPLMAVTQVYLGMGGGGVGGADEDSACAVFEALVELLDVDSPIVAPHVNLIVQAALATMGNTGLEQGTREAAGFLLVECIRSRRKLVIKTPGMLEAMLDTLMPMVAEYDEELHAETEAAAEKAGLSNNELTNDDLSSSAEAFVSALANEVREKAFFKVFILKVQPWLASHDHKKKRAALRLLGRIGDGCGSTLIEYLPQLLGLIVPLAGDAHPAVREALAMCLAYLCENCAPRVHQFHDQILPCILALLVDRTTSVARWATHVIETFCEDLPVETIRPYIPPLLDRLSSLMGSTNMGCKEAVLPALGSVALAAEGAFLPYLPSVAEALLSIMSHAEPALLPMRSKATECMGHISAAVGTEAFEPYFQRSLALALGGYSLADAELKSSCLLFLSASAESCSGHPAFIAILPQLLPTCVEMVTSKSLVASPLELGVSVGLPTGTGGEGEDDSDDDSDYDDDGVVEGVSGKRHSGDEGDDEEEEGGVDARLMDRLRDMDSTLRQTALSCLTHVLEYCPDPAAYVPHLDAMRGAFQGALVDELDPELMQEASRGVIGLLEGLHRAYPPPRDPVTGWPTALPPYTADALSNVLAKMVRNLKHSRSKRVVGTTCDALTRLCKRMGPLVLGGDVHAGVMAGLLAVLKEEAPCQLEDEDDLGGEEEEKEEEEEGGGRAGHGHGGRAGAEEGEEDEDGVHDTTVMDDAIDAVADVARCMGPAFATYLPSLMPVLERYTRASRPFTDQLAALGLCSDLVAVLPEELMAPYAEGVRGLLMTGVSSGYRDLQRNCAYGLGVLCQRMPGVMRPHVVSVLTALQPLFSLTRGNMSDDPVIDNAAGAVCRMLNAMPDLAGMPNLGAIPVVARALPLRDDHEEDATVFSTVLSSAAAGHPEALSVLADILLAAGTVLLPSSPVAQGVQSGVLVPGLKAVFAALTDAGSVQGGLPTIHFAPRLQAALEGLPAPQRAAVLAAVRA